MNEQNAQYYEGAELEKLVASIHWEKVLPVLYSITRNMMYKRFLTDGDRGIFGKTFKDFVHEAVAAFLEGRRRCPTNVKIEFFLFQTIRNIICKHLANHYKTVPADAAEEEILMVHYTSMNTSYDHGKIRSYVHSKLQADEICKGIFDCWAEGIDKPAEIRELYGYSARDYNSGRKRLLTILKDIRIHLKDER